jgi:4-hydroxyproline epimerase
MSVPEYPSQIEVIDSHTGGEPTRVVIAGWPQPEGATMEERLEALKRDTDHLRAAVVCEPRGHEAIVGAVLTPAVDPKSEAGVVFFNNASWLGMCGHGTIGLVRTLEHMGRIGPGKLRLDTPVGPVPAELHEDGSVTVQNVPAYTRELDVQVEVPGIGVVTGDIAWGGNWFFMAHLDRYQIALSNLAELSNVTQAIRSALFEDGLMPTEERELIHIELYGSPERDDADSKNFVLCPGSEYDRSPCGTGTSAKMAVLHDRGKLAIGDLWRQESITGSLFTCWLTEEDGTLIPHIRGEAYVTGRSTLLFAAEDDLRGGLTSA